MIGLAIFGAWAASLMVSAWIGFDRGFRHGQEVGRGIGRWGLD